MKRKIFCVLLCACMLCTPAALCCPFAVSAAGGDSSGELSEAEINGILEPGVPQNFNNADLGDPYGYGVGVPFLLSEQNELFVMHNYDGYSTAKVYDTLASKEGNTGRVVNSFQTSASQPTADSVRRLSFSKAVSFDPMGSGRKDHVAVVGVTESKDVVLVFYDTVNKKWSSAFTLGRMSWVTNSTEYYKMGEFLSITAGDYDGDHADTVVVYGSFDGGQGLFEVKMNKVGTSPVAVKKNTGIDRSMMNPTYNTVSGYSSFFKAGDSEGCDRLACVLATGDIDGDGIDDLAALSHGLGNRYYYNVEYVLPYLSVTLGRKGATGVFQSGLTRTGEYIHDGAKKYDSKRNSYMTFRAESMTFVNTDSNRGDDIVIAGAEVRYVYTASNNEFYDYYYQSGLAAAKYSFVNGKVTRNYYIDQCLDGDVLTSMDRNGFTDYGINGLGSGTAQVAVQGVYMNGKGNPAYVMIGGDLYDFSGEAMPEKIFNFSFLDSADKGIGGATINVNFIPAAAAGNFDGNDKGFEQIVMVLGRKQNSFDDTFFSLAVIGINSAKRDPKTGVVSDLSKAFYVTSTSAIETMDVDDEGDDLDEALAFLVVPVDNDGDGVLARYNSKDYLYSDPDVLAILQEAPFFGELDPYVADRAATTYSVSKSQTIRQGSSDSVSFGVGGKIEAGGAVVSASVSAGYALEWTQKFENSASFSVEESWSAQTDDSVILYRTPWFFFNYDVFDSKTGTWEENVLTVATENAPFYSQLSVREYNSFVDQYNKLLGSSASKALTKINAQSSHVGLHGNPYLYPDFAPETYGSYQQMAYNGAMTSVTGTWGTEKSRDSETSHGFTFDLEVLFGFDAFGAKMKAGIKTNLEYLHGTSSGKSEGTQVICGGLVQGIVGADMKRDGYTDSQIHAYSFHWKLGIWDSNVPAGNKDDAGNVLYVPVIGYVVKDVASLPRPVSEVNVEVRYDDVLNPKGVALTWNDPSASAKGYPKPTGYHIYLSEGGSLHKIGSTNYGTNEFLFTDLQKRSTLTFVVRSVNRSGSTTLESLDGAEGGCYVMYGGTSGGGVGGKGDKGDPGVGIADIALTSRKDNIDTYTITLTDGRTYPFTVTNAKENGATVIYTNDVAEGDYIIYSALDDTMCLDIAGGANAKSNGDNLQLWKAQDSGARVFTLIKDPNTGSYIIKAKHSGRVLDVWGSSTESGANVYQWEDYGNPNQRWVLEPAGNGYFYIRAVHGNYLDVSGGVAYNGVNVHSWAFHGGANQMFRLVSVSSGNSTRIGAMFAEGNVWIAVGLAAVVAAGVATLLIVKKKKKAKAEDGAN